MPRYDLSAVPPHLMRHLVREARVIERHRRPIRAPYVHPWKVVIDHHGLLVLYGLERPSLSESRLGKEPTPIAERLILVHAERDIARTARGWRSLDDHEERGHDPMAFYEAAELCDDMLRSALGKGDFW